MNVFKRPKNSPSFGNEGEDVGDAFGLTNGKIDKPNPIFTDDMPTAIQSFHKIAHLPTVEYVFTAHTGYSNDYKNAVNTQLK